MPPTTLSPQARTACIGPQNLLIGHGAGTIEIFQAMAIGPTLNSGCDLYYTHPALMCLCALRLDDADQMTCPRHFSLFIEKLPLSIIVE